MNDHNPPLIILAAGASSRMKKSLEVLHSRQDNTPSSVQFDFKNLPKPGIHKGLIPVDQNGKTTIDLIIDQAKKAGLSRIILIIQPPGIIFKKHFEDQVKTAGSVSGSKTIDIGSVNIDFAFQHIPKGRKKPLGTADALQQCLAQFPELLTQEFIVCNADNLYSSVAFQLLVDAPYSNALIGYRRQGLDFPMRKIRNFALLVTDREGCMKGLIEKPDEIVTKQLQDQGHELIVSMNIWKFNGTDLLKGLTNCPMNKQRQEKELPTAVQLMMTQHNIKLLVIPRTEHVPDLTQASDVTELRSLFKTNPLD